VADYFADTSGLAKRYISETGSAWVAGVLDPSAGAQTFVVRIAAVELIAAITRRERAGSITSADAATARSTFERDLDSEYQVVEVTAALVRRAMRLAAAHGMRGYDAVHLAASLEVNEALVASASAPLVLISADVELNAAAVAEGLAVEDPNAHP
jgi:uncharacterized protein